MIAENGEVFLWGQDEGGRLGHESPEEDGVQVLSSLEPDLFVIIYNSSDLFSLSSDTGQATDV